MTKVDEVIIIVLLFHCYLQWLSLFHFMLLEKMKMQQNEREHFEKMMKGHEKFRQDLKRQREELESREKELKKRTFHDDCERRKLIYEKKLVI